MKLKENIMDYLSIENIKLEIMRTAYGNPQSILGHIDARVLVIWYLFLVSFPGSFMI